MTAALVVLIAPLLMYSIIIRLYPGADAKGAFDFRGEDQVPVQDIKDDFPDHFEGSSRLFRLSFPDQEPGEFMELMLAKDSAGEQVVCPPEGGWKAHPEYFLFETEGKHDHGDERIVMGNGILRIFYPRLEYSET